MQQQNFRAELNALSKRIDDAIREVINEKGDSDNYIEIPVGHQKILGDNGDDFWDLIHWEIVGVGIDDDDELYADGGPDSWNRLSPIEKIQIYEAIIKP